MSNRPHFCTSCQIDGVCDSVVPFEPERECVFAVTWRCPSCQERSLVVSPLGPWLAPVPGMCLQCGRDGLADGEACPGCGLNIEEVLCAADAARSDVELLEAAREDFTRGTCRRALTLVNHVLRRNPDSGVAWSMKEQFFEHLGFQRAQKAAMQEAVRLKSACAVEANQTGDKGWWQFWR